MNMQKTKTFIRHNWIFYLIGFLAVFGLKYFYSKADADNLNWILAPTVWWVRILTGIPFVYDPCEGYVSHTCRFVIAPSCSGMQFMIITIATLIFSFVHRMKSTGKKLCWTVVSTIVPYFVTILVNTVRIIISIYLPVYLEQKSLTGGFLTLARLHTLIGTSVYFTSLFLIYHLAGFLTHQPFYKCLPPVFFYFALVLGVPFLNKAWQNNGEQFTEYAMLITCVCLVVFALYYLCSVFRKLLLKH